MSVASLERPTSGRTAYVRYAAGLAVAGVLLGVVLPRVTGATWGAVAHTVAALPLHWIFALVGLWAIGLIVNTIALRASLPTLSPVRALTLSLTGSAVANVMPLGGAAGMALNYRMLRAWGYARSQFATYTVVSNIWDVLGKVVLAAVVLPWALLVGASVLGSLTQAAAGVAVIAGVVALVAIASLLSTTITSVIASGLETAARAPFALVGSPRRLAIKAPLVEAQQQARDVVRRGWWRLSLGTAGYTILLATLLAACLHVAGVSVPPIAVLAAFAADRLFTLAGVTPGGAGFVELALASVLLAAGGVALPVTTAIVLYRLLTFGLEIPVGGLWLAAWEWRQRKAVAA